MIAIQVVGVSDVVTEEGLQALTEDLHNLCSAMGDKDYYVAFPPDRMKWDLGAELVALISGVALDASGDAFGMRVRSMLKKHFPDAKKIGIQLLEARTVVDLVDVS